MEQGTKGLGNDHSLIQAFTMRSVTASRSVDQCIVLSLLPMVICSKLIMAAGPKESSDTGNALDTSHSHKGGACCTWGPNYTRTNLFKLSM